MGRNVAYSTALDTKIRLNSAEAVARSENLGVPLSFGGQNLPLLVEIGLSDLPKYGGTMAPPSSPGTTGLDP